MTDFSSEELTWDSEPVPLLGAVTPTLAFTDDIGYAEVQSKVPVFTGWRPDVGIVGDVATAVGDATRHVFEFRRDYVAELSIPNLTQAQLAGVLRLKEHLLAGGTVTITTGDSLGNIFTVKLAPDTEPEIQFSDPAVREYTFRCVVRNTADTPLIAVY